MRHTVFTRLVATLLACWLPLVFGEVGPVHACAMHDGAHGGPQAAMHAGHAMPGHAATARDRHPPDSAAPVCSCVGHCGASSPVALLPALELHAAATTVVAAAAPGRPTHEWVAERADHVLPFGTAPPVVRS